MCGACGSAPPSWSERLAPLTPGSAPRRARALTALLRAADTRAAHRVTVTPWHGGGLRWHGPAGWSFARSLPDAARTLTRRYGPLVPSPGPACDEPGEHPLPFTVPDEVMAVWCAAALEAGWGAGSPCRLRLPAREVVLHQGKVTTAHARHTRPSLCAPHDLTVLVAHWSDTFHAFAH